MVWNLASSPTQGIQFHDGKESCFLDWEKGQQKAPFYFKVVSELSYSMKAWKKNFSETKQKITRLTHWHNKYILKQNSH